MAAGTDAIPGLAGASLAVDGGAEQSSVTLSEGVHQVVAKLSTQNPNAEYAVLGLWKGGKGYTFVGANEGYAYLDMPKSLYNDFYQKYPGDFRLVNQQMLVNLAEQQKPIILETTYGELELSHSDSAAYWEADTLLNDFGYSLELGSGPYGYDMLVPPLK